MKKRRWLFGLGVTTLVSLFLLGGCTFFEWMWEDPDPSLGSTVSIATQVKYEGEVETIDEPVLLGAECTLKAYDTENYEFWFWELNGQNVSEEAEYTVTASADATYYAVFVPKAEDEILINVVCEKDTYARIWYEDTGVSGGGYYKKGEEISLCSDSNLAASWFTVDEEKTRGPALEMTAKENVTVKAEFEYVFEFVIKDSPNCEIEMTEGESLVETGRAAFAYTLDEGYVADKWLVTYYFSSAVAQERETESYVLDHEAEMNPVLKVWTSVDEVRAEISLVVTNENLINTYEVQIVSSDGSGASVIAPEKRIEGRGYRATFIPNEDSYIQEIGLLTEGGFLEVNSRDYLGGEFLVHDASDLGSDETTVLRVHTIKKERAAIVNVISDDDNIKYDPAVGGMYTPSISTEIFVVAKGVPQTFQSSFYNNLKAIYDHGYQFSHISDAEGNRVSDTMMFKYVVNEDTDFYIHYSEKPVADDYFDYHLLEDGSGYEVRLSPLHDFYGRYAERVEELTIPSTYNGKPVTTIGAYGMSWYRKGLESDWAYISAFSLFKKLYVPGSIKVIKEKAFANILKTDIIIDEDAEFDYISPDAFYSENDSVQVKMTKAQLGSLVKELHEIYIGDSTGFEVRFEEDEHFDGEGNLGHYEAFTEYLCLKESVMQEISAFELSLIYHEFAHHYQFVARIGVEEETYDTLSVKPTKEEVDAWSEPYDTENYAAYWNHPMEVDARAFALQWTGCNQG